MLCYLMVDTVELEAERTGLVSTDDSANDRDRLHHDEPLGGGGGGAQGVRGGRKGREARAGCFPGHTRQGEGDGDGDGGVGKSRLVEGRQGAWRG